MTRSEAVRVVVIDDHALFRQGVIAAIGADPALEVVGEADDVQSGIDVVRAERPDVALLDVRLTSGSGLAVIEAVVGEMPGTQFLALSVSDEPADVLGLVRGGARGYVTKRIDGAELIDAIKRVANRDAVFSPRLAGFVLDAFSAKPPGTGTGSEPEAEGVEAELNRLTRREHEVMQHLARGYAYKEIAAELHISARTVESHASSVLRKLQMANRHELTYWAARNRLV